MKSDYLSMIVTHLNAPYGPVLRKATIKAALEAGSLAGLRCEPLQRELLETLFIECAPSLIGRACYQIGVGLENAQALYVELRKGRNPAALKWEVLGLQGLWNPVAPETTFELEPPLEVLAKKLFYRGWVLTPRDLFDWYCIEQHAPGFATNCGMGQRAAGPL